MLVKFFRRLAQHLLPKQQPIQRRQVRGRPLFLEALEDRVVPAPIQLIDNVGPTAIYTAAGNFRASALGYGVGSQFTPVSSTSSTARWTATVEPGKYQVWATWNPRVVKASASVPYSIFDGSKLLKTVNVNQTKAPTGVTANGVVWQSLGTYTALTKNLIVRLNSNGKTVVIADAIRVASAGPLAQVFNGTTQVANGGSVSLGSTTVGQPVTKTLTVKNDGATALTLSGLVLPSGFSLASSFGATTLAAGASTTFSIRLTATTAKTFGGTLSFTTNNTGAPKYNITLAGTVTASPPAAQLFDGTTAVVNGGSVSFGTTTIGQSLAKTFTVQNVGGQPLTLGSVTLPSGFTLASAFGTTTVAAGASTSFSVRLDAAATGTFGGLLSFATNSLNAPLYTFTLAGLVDSGPVAQLLDGTTAVVNGGGVAFGSTPTGQGLTKTFTVRNNGDRSLTLGSVVLPSGYSLATGFGTTTVAAGASTTFSVRLDATAAGNYSGTVSFTTNDVNAPTYGFTTSGTVQLGPVARVLNGTTLVASGGSVSFGSTQVSTPLVKTFTVRNDGDQTLTLGSVTVGTGFSLSTPFGSTTLTAGASTTFSLRMDAATEGNYSAAITFTTNSAQTPTYSFTATGTVSGQNIVTPFDRIPNFGANPTIVSIVSGAWSNPTTWSLGRVPTTGDVVSIGTNATVIYDVISTVAVDTVVIQAGGHLVFRTDVSTKLTVKNLLVLEQGELQIGTLANPVVANVKAEVIFADIAIDTTRDPSQYGNGLIGLGKVTMHGAVKSDTFVRLAIEPRVGDTTLTLSQSISGWAAGDRLVLPDTRQDRSIGNQLEMLTLASVSADGRVLTLNTPLQFDHLGARDGNGTLDFLTHVGNLTRNVVVRSANARGTRGHTLFTERADVDIRYAQFSGLGRTTVDPFNNTTYAGDGSVTQVGTNQQDRYSVNFRHLLGPATTPANGNQYTFVGNSVFCPIDPMPFRWGINVHDSHYGLIKDNVLYNWAGAAVMLETGSESYNVLENNFAVRVTQSADRLRADGRGYSDLGFEGSAFWFRGPNNFVRSNVAANATTYGYTIFVAYVGNVQVPAFRGAGHDQYVTVNMNAIPLLEFVDNEVYGSGSGLNIWWLGTNGPAPAPVTGDSIVRDFVVWHPQTHGYFAYETNRLVLDGFVARGDWQQLESGRASNIGLYFSDYFTRDFVAQNADIQGMKIGVMPSTHTDGTALTIRDSYLRNYFNVEIGLLWTSGYAANSIPGRTVVIDTVRFDTPTLSVYQFGMPYHIGRWFTAEGSVQNLIQRDQVEVRNYNGVLGDNFRVYMEEQRANAVLFQSVLNGDGSARVLGSPEAGLTNQEAWDRYGVASGGEVAPNDAVARTGIRGLVKPF